MKNKSNIILKASQNFIININQQVFIRIANYFYEYYFLLIFFIIIQ